MNERQFVTIGLFAMARENPALWDVEVFKVIIQAVVLTGLLNMVGAFHFASNKGSEVARENTGKAMSAIEAVAKAGGQAGGQDSADTLHSGDSIKMERTVS
jgi:hypothetical protein